MDQLQGLIGLDKAKAQIDRFVASAMAEDARREAAEAAGEEYKAPERNNHMVFLGNPGTGKTTVARLVAPILKDLGRIKTAETAETNASDLISSYEGETKEKTQKYLEDNVGKVIFIDEAYTLVPDRGGRSSHGKEALEVILTFAEEHRGDTAIVMAGYPGDMAKLMGVNPGMESRFPTVVDFEDYSAADLMKVAQQQMVEGGERLGTGARKALASAAQGIEGLGSASANARDVRNLLVAAREARDLRLVDEHGDLSGLDRDELHTLMPEDIQRAWISVRSAKKRSGSLQPTGRSA